jgi:steroid delta-isomerase-like uncharacterized protein
MTRDEIVAMFARRQQALERLDARALAADYTDDGVVESPFAGGTATGRTAIAGIYEAYFRTFSDLKVMPEDMLIDGDRVVLVQRISGTETGGFMGMPPSGRSMSFRAVVLYELQDGLIARERRVYDFTGVLLQVGAPKAKPL